MFISYWPTKSNWTSSLGSTNGGSSDILFLGMSGFRFLPILMHGWQFCVRVTISRCIRGNQMRFARCIIPVCPGCFLCMAFIIGFRSCVGMNSLPWSMMHPVGVTPKSRFNECQYRLNCFSVVQSLSCTICSRLRLWGSALVASAMNSSPRTLCKLVK